MTKDSKEDKKNKNAAALGRLGGLRGGKARADALTKQARSDIARKAASARWGALARETHTGVIELGSIMVPCSVLSETGGRVRRVIHRAGIRSAFDVRSRSSSAGSTEDQNIPGFLAGPTIAPFLSGELRSMFAGSIAYKTKAGPGTPGVLAYGYPAEILPLLCESILDAAATGKLQPSQQKMVVAARALHRALARVGVVALVDEATGYQDERDRNELAKLLRAYVVEELQPWIDKFPHEFFKQVHRLWGWEYKEGSTQGPRYVGKIISDVIYKRMPPGVHERMVELNPAIDGRRRHKHYQHLTGDTGIPDLDKRIASVTTLMAVSDDRAMFEALLKKRFPKRGDQQDLLLGVIDPPTDE
jgi:hypothetical protein